ncbi:MAG TPA: hypothetical protein VFX51_01845, partial [Solirubrobacteraceae bacterium]|nr:hypothetical protein [Solirubrobacteraceae bacterium]
MSSVRIRMFRQGLGDCFLLTFDTGDAPKQVLIDCGVLKGTPDSGQRMLAVAEAIRDETGGHLDVLVATHEHWDHLSGFHQAREVFEGLAIDDVWLAWTEDRADDIADSLRMHRQRALKAVEAAAQRLGACEGEVETRIADRLVALLDFEDGLGAAGGATTAAAMQWVAARKPESKPFLRPGDQLSAGESGLGGDVRTYVLGPPRDVKQIKRSDPSRRAPEVYELAVSAAADRAFYAAVESLGDGEEAEEQPFVRYYRFDQDDPDTQKRFADYLDERQAWRRIDNDWLGVAGRLALHLDSDTNNTSLALAFELGPDGPVLLFPGDAQVGNWLSWEALRWTVDEASGSPPRVVSADDLLARTILYKVGHHASHNATLRERGLELMTSRDLVAMIPVNRVTARKQGWNMPFPPLFKRLEEKTEGRIL